MTPYPITLIFADGATCTVEVGAGHNIVQAFADNGFALLTDCSTGRCGTCMGRLLSGIVELGDYDEQTLLEDDRSKGMILPCVATATEACVIELPYDVSEVTAENSQIPVKIVESVLVAEDIFRLTLDLDAPLNFLPGQYVRLTPEGHLFTRSYSMANRPGTQSAMFYVRLILDGAFSTWAKNETNPGSMVFMSHSHGGFFLRSEDRPRLFVAGGTGLAPFLSMLHTMYDVGEQSAPTQIFVGARTERHLFCLSELSEFASKIPTYEFVRLLKTAQTLDSMWATRPTRSAQTLSKPMPGPIFVPPAMVDAGRKALERINIPSREVLCERFA